MEPDFTPKQKTPEEIAQLEKSRTISDAQFLTEGAEYAIKSETGEKSFNPTKKQIEKEHEKMENVLMKDRINRYFEFMQGEIRALISVGDEISADSLKSKMEFSKIEDVQDAVFKDGRWAVTFKDGAVEEARHHMERDIIKKESDSKNEMLREKWPLTTEYLVELLGMDENQGCLYCCFGGPTKENRSGRTGQKNLHLYNPWPKFLDIVKKEIGMEPNDLEIALEKFENSNEPNSRSICFASGPRGVREVLLKTMK